MSATPSAMEWQAFAGAVIARGTLHATPHIGLTMSVTKDKLGLVRTINDTFGGRLHGPYKNTYHLSFRGKALHDIATRLLEHVPECRKRRELEVVLRWPLNSGRLTDEARATRRAVKAGLAALRGTGDEAEVSLSLATTAGMLAASGSVTNDLVSISRTSRAMCDAIRQAVGAGSVTSRGSRWTYQVPVGDIPAGAARILLEGTWGLRDAPTVTRKRVRSTEVPARAQASPVVSPEVQEAPVPAPPPAPAPSPSAFAVPQNNVMAPLPLVCVPAFPTFVPPGDGWTLNWIKCT